MFHPYSISTHLPRLPPVGGVGRRGPRVITLLSGILPFLLLPLPWRIELYWELQLPTQSPSGNAGRKGRDKMDSYWELQLPIHLIPCPINS